MGYFCLPNGDTKEDLIDHIRCSIELYERTDGSYDYLLEMAKGSLEDLIFLAKELKVKSDAKEALERAEFKKKNRCMNCEFWDTKDYPAPPPKWIYYCNKSEDKDVMIQMKSQEDCELFERKEEC